MAKIPFIGGWGSSRSPNADAQRTVNMYAEIDMGGKNADYLPDSPYLAALYPTPGMKAFADLGATTPVTALHEFNGMCFAVSGNKLYQILQNGTTILKGSFATSVGNSARFSVAHNDHELILTNGQAGYIYHPAMASWVTGGGPQVESFARITTAGYNAGPISDYTDGFFLTNIANTSQWQISGLQDGFTWNPVNYTSAEGAPDNLVRLIVNHREIWAFGDQSTEVYYNSGGNYFPFDRIQGAFIETGCAAPWSAAKMDNSVFWLGKDQRGQGLVFRANGYVPQVISTRALEARIATYDTISDAFAFTLQMMGHQFYALIFPAANESWLFDASTSLWSQWEYFDPISGPGRHRANCACFCFGKQLVGDYQSGKIFELDAGTYTDAGQPIRRIRAGRHMHNERKRLLHRAFEVDFEFGVGTSTGQGVDPQAMMRYSDDGGHTWSSERWASLGKIGQYKARARWRCLGYSRDRVYEVTVTDPVNVVIVGAYVDLAPAVS